MSTNMAGPTPATTPILFLLLRRTFRGIEAEAMEWFAARLAVQHLHTSQSLVLLHRYTGLSDTYYK